VERKETDHEKKTFEKRNNLLIQENSIEEEGKGNKMDFLTLT